MMSFLKKNKILSFFGNERNFLIFIFVLALSLRLFHVYYVVDSVPFSDSLEYHNYAIGMLEEHRFGDEYTSTYRGPVFSFLLSIIYFLYGKSYHVARIFQAIISSFTCIIIYLLAKHIFSKATAYVAALISATFALYIFYSGFLLSETLFLFLSVFLALVLYETLEEPSNKTLIFSGLLLGITALTRTEILFTFIFIIPIFWIKSQFSLKTTGKQLALVMAFAFLIILPWTLRNYLVSDHFVLISSQGGENFWMGNNPKTIGMHIPVPEDILEKYGSQIELDKSLSKKAINFIVHNPKKWLELLKDKFLLYFQFWDDKNNWMFTERFGFINNLSPPLCNIKIIGVFCIFGMLLTIRYIKQSLILYAFLLSNFAMQILLYVEPRWRVQISPFMIIFAASLIFVVENTIIKKFFPQFYAIESHDAEVESLPNIIDSIREKKYEDLYKTAEREHRKRFVMKMVILLLCVFLIIVTSITKRIIDHRINLNTLKEIIIIEGEAPISSNFHTGPGYMVKNKKMLKDSSIELQTNIPVEGGYFINYEFDIKNKGAYNVYIAGTPPGPDKKGSEWFSPYTVTVDNNTPEFFTEEKLLNEWPHYRDYEYIAGGYFYIKLFTLDFATGKHTVNIKIDKRRKFDGNFTFFIDALIVSPSNIRPEYNVRKIPKKVFHSKKEG